MYHGSYAPLNGVHMSEAYARSIRLSFDVRAGLVMRQIHHWAALLFVGVDRRPPVPRLLHRRVPQAAGDQLVVGVTLLLLAHRQRVHRLLAARRPAVGHRPAHRVLDRAVDPARRHWLAFLVFGGEFPAPRIIGRLFVIHILLVPAADRRACSASTSRSSGARSTRSSRAPGRTERNVVGSRLWPTYAAKSVGLFAFVAAVLAPLGGLAQINPVWLYGPFEPAAVTTAAQPDWYVGWLEGALRLCPPWRIHLGPYTIPEVFWPGRAAARHHVRPAVRVAVPRSALHRRPREHHLLDRPRDRPVRTAIGVGVLTFYIVLLVAGGQDIIAQEVRAPITRVSTVLQILCVTLPFVIGRDRVEVVPRPGRGRRAPAPRPGRIDPGGRAAGPRRKGRVKRLD